MRWWDRSATTFRTAVLGMEGREHELPDEPVLHDYHYAEAVPVFFGHYWLRDEPTLTNTLAACLDYSVADKGCLTSYRWTGERTLAAENLVWEAADIEVLVPDATRLPPDIELDADLRKSGECAPLADAHF